MGWAAAALLALLALVGLVLLLRQGPGTWRYSLAGGASRDVTVPLGGYAFVSVPRGSLAHDASISVERTSPPCAPSRCHVLPLGDPFRVRIEAPLLAPVLIAARYDAVTLARHRGYRILTLAYFDGAKHRWVPVATSIDLRRRYVTTLTSRKRPTVWMPVATS